MRGLLHLDVSGRAVANADGLDRLTNRQASLREWTLQHSRAATTDPTSTYLPEQIAIEDLLEDRTAMREHEARPTVLVRHRNEWLVELLDAALAERGMRAVRAGGSDAATVGALVVAQPEVLLVSEHLPGGSGLRLVERARSLSPATMCVVQVEADGNARSAIASGAQAVLSRGVSVPDLVQLLSVVAPLPPELAGA